MTCLLGIDIGTSSVKAIVADERGRVYGVGMQEYPIRVPQPGWGEQEPEDWWSAGVRAARAALAQAGDVSIHGIGCCGQMHGFALIDRAGQTVRPAIIWTDQRSQAEVPEIISLVGRPLLAESAGTAPATGFACSTLRWLQKHEPDRLERAAYCLQPKDYVRFRLTGHPAPEVCDASATGLFDIRTRKWSGTIIERLGLPPDLFPSPFESSEVAGTLLPEPAGKLGLPPGIPVVAGSTDQAAQLVGHGLINPGIGLVLIGTGGQVVVSLDEPKVDPELRIHIFCHAPHDRWYALGAMLSAGLSFRWFRDLLGMTLDQHAYSRLAELAAEVPPGAGGLLFLPYLVGERAPLMDPSARGCLIGLAQRHGRGHLVRAIMEGVAFASRQIIETMALLDVNLDRLIASGNGLASPVWRQIVADVLGKPLLMADGRERASLGAALIAGIGTGVYANYDEAAKAIAPSFTTTEPDPRRAALYTEQYGRFLQLYPLLAPIMHELTASDLETGQ